MRKEEATRSKTATNKLTPLDAQNPGNSASGLNVSRARLDDPYRSITVCMP
jgi:hypothetical protein